MDGAHSPLTTFWTTRTVEISECWLNALVAYADSDMIVWPSRDVQKAIRKILLESARAYQLTVNHAPDISYDQRPSGPCQIDSFDLPNPFLQFIGRVCLALKRLYLWVMEKSVPFLVTALPRLIHCAVGRTSADVEVGHSGDGSRRISANSRVVVLVWAVSMYKRPWRQLLESEICINPGA